MAKATIHDVAALAGVSIKTVSRVVNNEPRVRESTIEKVQQAIQQLGYRPSTSARSLAGNRSYLLALLYDNPNAHYVIDVQYGALEACQTNHYELIIRPCRYQDKSTLQDIESLVSNAKVDGFILTPPLSDTPAITKALTKLEAPFVCISSQPQETLSPSVGCDDFKASYEMTETLIQHGHQRIGFIIGHPDHSTSAARLAGFEKALADHKITQKKNLLIQGYNDAESGQKAAEKLLALKQPPSAIFASNDDMAAGALQVAQQHKIQVPEQLSIAGFDDSPISQLTWPPITTIQQPTRAMGSKAVELLLDQLREPQQQHPHTTLPYTLLARESLTKISDT
ncbi:LacI family DNA-binding transcriptional regulator [Maricurvus nonylphenolicus]|uniref:LacI family DNA-binding transcriptional regulator n=1 Tax=Maricurvus nonylphenolicus TaxID=1008307 RepID=UPI0036F1E6A9